MHSENCVWFQWHVRDTSAVSHTHLHVTSVCTWDSCDLLVDHRTDFPFFTSLIVLALHEKSDAGTPAPADSPWIDEHKHCLPNFRASPFSRRAQIPVQKSWWLSQSVHPQILQGPRAPGASQRDSLRTQLVERQGIWRNVFFQVGLPQKQHTTTALLSINWKNTKELLRFLVCD